MAISYKRIYDVITVWMYVILLVCDVTVSLKNPRREQARTKPEDVDIQISRERKSSRDIGRKLTVTTVLEAPYMVMKPYSMGSFITGNDLFEGYMADIVRNLSQSIGFEYVIKLALDGKYGEPDLDDNWNGMIGEIQRGEADIAIGPITMTPERAQVVDFTDSFMAFRSTALLKKPRGRGRGRRYRVETSEDLMQSDVIYGVIDGSILQRVMRTSEEPMIRGMWARMVNFWPTAFVQSVQEGLARITRENYGFIVDTPLAEYLIGQEPCELYAIEPFLNTRRYAIALRKGDVLKAEIDEQLRLMHEKQVMSEFYLKWWRSSCDLYVPNNDKPRRSTTPSYTTKSPNEQGQVGHYGSRASRDHVHIVLMLCTTLCLCLISLKQYFQRTVKDIFNLDT